MLLRPPEEILNLLRHETGAVFFFRNENGPADSETRAQAKRLQV